MGDGRSSRRVLFSAEDMARLSATPGIGDALRKVSERHQRPIREAARLVMAQHAAAARPSFAAAMALTRANEKTAGVAAAVGTSAAAKSLQAGAVRKLTADSPTLLSADVMRFANFAAVHRQTDKSRAVSVALGSMASPVSGLAFSALMRHRVDMQTTEDISRLASKVMQSPRGLRLGERLAELTTEPPPVAEVLPLPPSVPVEAGDDVEPWVRSQKLTVIGLILGLFWALPAWLTYLGVRPEDIERCVVEVGHHVLDLLQSANDDSIS